MNDKMQNALSSPFSYRLQRTVKSELPFKGIGLHSGIEVSVKIKPADPNTGIEFIRTDLGEGVRIPAHYDSVVATEMSTTLGCRNGSEARIGTVEHLISALFGMGVSNATIEVDGAEIPILDGSAAPFVERLAQTGTELQPYSTPILKIYRPVRIYREGVACELLPRDRLRLTTSIYFPHPEIGPQTFAMELTPEIYRDQVGSARTFGFERDLEKLHQANLAKGASLENVLAFSEDGVLNPDGKRYPDECARHKLLDAVGDMALCGCWIEGELVSFRGGHSIHLAMLQSLKDFPNYWEILPSEKVDLSAVMDMH